MKKTFLFSLIVIVLVSGCIDNIDYSCETDADCAIKNVGNKCGYYPLCVNKDFSPNPPELDSNICGFPHIDSCKCVDNVCEIYVDYDKTLEERWCDEADGEWKEFSNTCVDSCESSRIAGQPVCGDAITVGCDCGEYMCWTGTDCEEI